MRNFSPRFKQIPKQAKVLRDSALPAVIFFAHQKLIDNLGKGAARDPKLKIEYPSKLRDFVEMSRKMPGSDFFIGSLSVDYCWKPGVNYTGCMRERIREIWSSSPSSVPGEVFLVVLECGLEIVEATSPTATASDARTHRHYPSSGMTFLDVVMSKQERHDAMVQ